MIPKVIHAVWIGDESRRPDRCIQTWRDCNPDFEVRLWGNRQLREAGWINAAHMRTVPAEHLAAVADMMRYEILWRHGGVTIDADSVCVRPLPEWLLEPREFVAWENELIRPGLLSVATLGSEPGSLFFRAVVDHIHHTETVADALPWIRTGPVPMTQVWRNLAYPLTIHPSHYFTPDHFDGPRYGGTGPVFSRQLWSSTRASIEGRGETFAPFIEVAG